MSINNEYRLGEIAPGWSLISGVWGGEEILGICPGNHPVFIFPLASIPGGALVKDLSIGMDVDTLNALDDLSPEWLQISLSGKQVDYIEGEMSVMPEIGYNLVSACIKAGFSPEKDGRFTCWLIEKMADIVENYNKPESSATTPSFS